VGAGVGIVELIATSTGEEVTVVSFDGDKLVGEPDGTPTNESLIPMSMMRMGLREGAMDRTILGISDGIALGCNEGHPLCITDGIPLGSPDGSDDPEGLEDAIIDGSSLGSIEGNDEPEGVAEGGAGFDGRVDGT
jgi:hypothetical protein